MEFTLRDTLAVSVPSDEISNLSYQHLSRSAQEKLTGLRYPRKEDYSEPVGFHIDELKFKCAVSAALRYLHADEMLKYREVK